MKKIFEKIHLNHLTLKNRLVRSATWEGIAVLDGSIDERTYRIYEELAAGGIGAIVTGFTSVCDNDFYFDGMMRLSHDELIPQYKKLTDIIHSYGVPVISQLALGAFYRTHGGRGSLQVEPDDMTREEIELVENQFADAARRAKEAGFDGVQIHAAHFFFLSRFISPAVNHRSDTYGGSTENRARIVREILAKIRETTPNLHVSIKINSSDFTQDGLTEKESLEICRLLDKDGIDSIEASGNGTSVGGIRAGVNEGYFVPFASRLSDEIKTPVICVGGFRSRAVMEDALNKTDITALSLSRPLVCEPDFPHKLQTDKSEVSKCVSCNGCYSSYMHRCVFNRNEANS